MRNRFAKEDIFLIFIMSIFLISTFIRDNYYLNIVVAIAGGLVILILNMMEPVKSILINKKFDLFTCASVLINLVIIVVVLLYLLVFRNTILIIILILLFVLDVLIDFFVKKSKDFTNYIFLLVLLVYLFHSFSKL